MQIRVLGCSGSIAAGFRTTCFLVDDDVLIDAGTGVAELGLSELVAIDDIFLTHSHLDHVLSVPLLADSVMRARQGRGPIRVHALPATIAVLRKHLFNGAIWPDFTVLPTAQHPILELLPIEVGQTLALSRGRRIEVLPAVHTVAAVGYALAARQGAWVFTGDTGPNPALWQRLQTLPVSSLIIETAFGDAEHDLAVISRHLCPSMLATELRQLTQDCEVFITHIKPGETEAVMSQVASDVSRPGRIRALEVGQVFELD
jgi:ribonuclease BN (tRNA processing enzyme)